MKKNQLTKLLIILATLLTSCKHPTQTPKNISNPLYDTLTLEELSQLQDGDIILRRGNAFFSDLIVKTLQEPYPLSHCGILVKKNGEWYVISSELSEHHDGAKIEKISNFNKGSIFGSTIVSRPILDKQQLKAFVDAGYYYVRTQKKFDREMNLADTSSFYCTELVYHCYLQSTQKDVFLPRTVIGGKEGIGFKVFLDTSLFKPILSHF